jgi:hypothetical protein
LNVFGVRKGMVVFDVGREIVEFYKGSGVNLWLK